MACSCDLLENGYGLYTETSQKVGQRFSSSPWLVVIQEGLCGSGWSIGWSVVRATMTCMSVNRCMRKNLHGN